MTGFEPRSSGIRSDRSANFATTTAHWAKRKSKVIGRKVEPIEINKRTLDGVTWYWSHSIRAGQHMRANAVTPVMSHD